MNSINHFLLIASLSTGISIRAAEPPSASPTNEAPSAPATPLRAGADQSSPPPAGATETVTNAVATAPVPDLATNAVAGSNAGAGTNAVATANPAVPPVVVENGTNGVRMNFNKAPLNLVLDYLSDAAGFIINKETDVRGTVDVQGKDLTKDEAVEVLNSALKKNGYAVVRNWAHPEHRRAGYREDPRP